MFFPCSKIWFGAEPFDTLSPEVHFILLNSVLFKYLPLFPCTILPQTHRIKETCTWKLSETLCFPTPRKHLFRTLLQRSSAKPGPSTSLLENMHSLFLILNVGSDSNFPRRLFLMKKWVNLRCLLDILHGKISIFSQTYRQTCWWKKHPTFQPLEVSAVWGKSWDISSTPCGTKAWRKSLALFFRGLKSEQL